MYPPEVARDPLGWAAKRKEPKWGDLVAPKEGPILQGWVDVDRLLADMDEAGVEKAILLGWYWENHETCIEQNIWYREWIREHPDRLMAFATLHPKAGEAALEEVRRAEGEGFLGLGELSHRAQRFSMDDPDWLRVVDLAIEKNLPINLHVNEPVGRLYPGRLSDHLEDYVGLAAQFPDLILILAHWGGLLPFYELNRAVRKKLKNVFYDTAATPLLYDSHIYRAAVDVIGPDRILYGSDYPLRLYPRQRQEPDFTSLIHEIRKSGLTPAEQKQILGTNILELLRSRPHTQKK